MQEEEKLIDIKGTLEKFIEPDEPEMTQEEAITKYKENFFKKNNAIAFSSCKKRIIEFIKKSRRNCE